jgi:uncharacterized OB-fold protein
MSFTGTQFNQYLAEHKLMGTRCASCGALHLPPHPICTTCHSDDVSWTAFSGRGRLLAFTTVHIAPTAMIEAGYGRDRPYCTGVVQLEEGPSISAQILGVDAARPEEIAIGTPLQVAFVQREEGPDGKTRTYLAFEKSG